MTSNLGSEHLLQGIDAEGQLSDDVRDRVLSQLRGHFRPEFLNRVDDIVLFKPLLLEEIQQIVDLLIVNLNRRLADQDLAVELTPAAREFIAREGFDPVYGARPLKRFLQRSVETRLGRAIVAGEIEDGAKVIVDVSDGELLIEAASQ